MGSSLAFSSYRRLRRSASARIVPGLIALGLVIGGDPDRAGLASAQRRPGRFEPWVVSDRPGVPALSFGQIYMVAVDWLGFFRHDVILTVSFAVEIHLGRSSYRGDREVVIHFAFTNCCACLPWGCFTNLRLVAVSWNTLAGFHVVFEPYTFGDVLAGVWFVVWCRRLTATMATACWCP